MENGIKIKQCKSAYKSSFNKIPHALFNPQNTSKIPQIFFKSHHLQKTHFELFITSYTFSHMQSAQKNPIFRFSPKNRKFYTNICVENFSKLFQTENPVFFIKHTPIH